MTSPKMTGNDAGNMKTTLVKTPALLIPGYDDANRNKNSCLYKVYGESACVCYTPGEFVSFPADSTEILIVHSYGFYAFLAGRSAGLLRGVKKLIVIDGYFPSNQKWGDVAVRVEIPKDISCVFFFPTYGDRSGYPLESVVRQAMVERRDITVARGVGYGHNLLHPPTEDTIREIVSFLAGLPSQRQEQEDIHMFAS